MRTSIPKTEAIFSEDPISSTYHQPGHRNLTGDSLLGFPIAFFWAGRDGGSELFKRGSRRGIRRGHGETGKWSDGVMATSNQNETSIRAKWLFWATPDPGIVL